MTTERPMEFTLVPGQSATFVIGAENDFVNREGKLYAGPSASNCLPKVAELLARARRQHMKIFFVHSARPSNATEPRDTTVFPLPIEGTWGSHITDELAPLRGETIVESNSFDCFARTDLESALRRYDVRSCQDKVVIVGGSIHAGLYQAITGFSVRHYYVLVPLDCVYGDDGARRRVVERLSMVGYNHNVALTASDSIRMKPRLWGNSANESS
jgi:nicotinamidase-related amidase